MCGIAGFFHLYKDRLVSQERLIKMTDVLYHRGPDDRGYWTNKNVALGHRRLSIIDLTTGQQPMSFKDGQLVISYNGEIYNYIELKGELKKRGYQFRTNSDTEVILASYSEWGASSLLKFNGMWAFALWDKGKQRLFCSRDRLGEKPFFYTIYEDTFVFASEIKALFEYGVPQIVNVEILDAYLCFGYIPAPFTFFKNINKLNPGHSLVVENGLIKIQQYWDMQMLQEKNLRNDEEEILKEFEELFSDAVRIRMRSDVSFGAFLSGGLDSGSVVSAMREISSRPVKTYTIGFNESEFDERNLARLVAQRFETDHHEKIVVQQDMAALMKKLAWHYDEPFGDSSALPTYIVCKMTRNHVKMALTGDGGDEALSGYTVHQGEKFSQHFKILPPIFRQIILSVLRMIKNISPSQISGGIDRPTRAIESANMDFVDRLESKQIGFKRMERQKLLKGFGKDIRPAKEFIEETLKPVGGIDNFNMLNYWLLKVYLPDDILCKVDRASMANSLETRLPFLDHRIIELMCSVSMSIKLKGYTRKHVLRGSVGKKLPVKLLKAKKRGFAMPVDNWSGNRSGAFLEKEAMKAATGGLVDRNALHEIINRNKLAGYNTGNALWILGMLGNYPKINSFF